MSKTAVSKAILHESLFAAEVGDLGKILGPGAIKTPAVSAVMFYADGILEVTAVSAKTGKVTLLVPLSNVKMMQAAPEAAPAAKDPKK